MDKFKKPETREEVAILNDFNNQQLGQGGREGVNWCCGRGMSNF
jgi:hypothetical protein